MLTSHQNLYHMETCLWPCIHLHVLRGFKHRTATDNSTLKTREGTGAEILLVIVIGVKHGLSSSGMNKD